MTTVGTHNPNARPPDCAQGEDCWSQDWTKLNHPCKYGHFDCSVSDRGPCSDQHTAIYDHPDDERHEEGDS